ncbi:hypothetical protein LR48_Vigan468s009300 [Vigna angularis]|uniref:Integrase zinc-binding domain-containing protein n=1 Tax=Phaseolus angularis TaxID=3914 RepID=A0A0L9TC11_PHAAN|nr:hypothetical protein LR48_Vigan468s009300 [Vigna angularis]
MSAVMEDLLVNPTAHSLYELQKGRLYYHDKLVLPKHYSRIPTIIQELHESPLGGHSGYFRILKRIAGALHWEGMRKDIKAFVMQCETWQRNKSEMLAPTKANGKDTIFVVVDRLTKYAHFLHYHILTLLRMWFLSKKWLGCTGFLPQSFQIETSCF